MRRRRFLIGGFIVFLAVGYLGYIGFQEAATYYYTVGELLEQGSSIYGENVRVNGQVAPGSVEQEAAGRILRFTIIDGEESLPVVYQGIVPDTFKVGNEVVIEGHLNSAGIFQAHTLMPRCPSRYVPKK
ncbi:Cytochrome c-type biogenesis protein CcmE [subsurface metagenome]